MPLFKTGLPGVSSPQGLALIGILAPFLSIPLFLTQSFMSLGDMTVASVVLAGGTILMPVMMLVTLLKLAKTSERSFQHYVHGFCAIAVLQWCVVLAYFEMLPLRLWV